MKSILLTVIVVCYVIDERAKVNARVKFTEVVKSQYFVDKTLILQDFLNDDDPDDARVMEITAPSLSGKTTIVDMVKRFAKIITDDKGNPIPPNATENYKMFCKPPLNICKNKTFIDLHLGQHPVIYINYQRLLGVIDYESLLFEIRETLSETFLEHRYLEQVDDLWPRVESITKEEFSTYIDSGKHLDIATISRAFYLLSYVLHTHFQKKVLVLIDDYDAYARKVIFTQIEDKNSIIDFCMALNNRLLKPNNPYLYKAVVTGVLRISGEDTLVHDYIFRGDHQFSKYYGYNFGEIEKILAKKKVKEIEGKMKTIELYYGGFTILKQNESLFNYFSVTQYFNNGMRLAPYWFLSEYINQLSRIICRSDIIEVLLQLVKGHNYDLYIKERFRKAEIFALSKMNSIGKIYEPIEIYWFFLLLYSLGYLTTTGQGLGSLTPLKVTNVDLLMDLTREVKLCYKKEFGFKQNDILELRKALDSFQPGKVKSETFPTLRRNIYNLFNNSRHYPNTDEELQNILFLTVLEKFYRSKGEIPLTYTMVEYNETTVYNGQVDILVMNTHNVAVVLKVRLVEAERLKVPLDELALAVHDQIVAQQHQYILEHFGDVSGRVYAGLVFHKDSGNVSLACSSSTGSDGDYKDGTVIIDL